MGENMKNFKPTKKKQPEDQCFGPRPHCRAGYWANLKFQKTKIK
jgi:hypothetical protein